MINPAFLYALRNRDFERSIMRIVAKDIPTWVIFEACVAGQITPEEGALIMELQDESDYWIIRTLSSLWNWVML